MKHISKRKKILYTITLFITLIVFLFGFIQGTKGISYQLFGIETKCVVVADIDTDEEKYLLIKYVIEDKEYTSKVQNAKDTYKKDDTFTIFVSKKDPNNYVIYPRYLYISLIPFFIGLAGLIYSLTFFIKSIKKERMINHLIHYGDKVTATITDAYYEDKEESLGITPFIIVCEYQNTRYTSELIYKDWNVITGLIGSYVTIYIEKKTDNYFIDIETIESKNKNV